MLNIRNEEFEKIYNSLSSYMSGCFLTCALVTDKKKSEERSSLIWATVLDCVCHEFTSAIAPEKSSSWREIVDLIVEEEALFCDKFKVNELTMHYARILIHNNKDDFSIKISNAAMDSLRNLVSEKSGNNFAFISELIRSNEDFLTLPVAKLMGGAKEYESRQKSEQKFKFDSRKFSKLIDDAKEKLSVFFDGLEEQKESNYEQAKAEEGSFVSPWSRNKYKSNPSWEELTRVQIKNLAKNYNLSELSYNRQAAIILFLAATHLKLSGLSPKSLKNLSPTLEFLSKDNQIKSYFIVYNQSILFAEKKLENRDSAVFFIFTKAEECESLNNPLAKDAIVEILNSDVIRW